MLLALPIGVVAAVLLGPRLAESLAMPRPAAWLLALSVTAIVVVTLVPLGADTWLGADPTCLVPSLDVLGSGHLLELNDESLNVLLFVPLGFALAAIPGRRRWAGLACAAALPWLLEATQLLVPVLGRQCQAVDLTTNLLGLGIGFAAGLVVWGLASRRR